MKKSKKVCKSIEDAAGLLNYATSVDPTSMGLLLQLRVHAGYRMEKQGKLKFYHSPDNYDIPTVGILEVINTLYYDSGLQVEPVFHNKQLTGFQLTRTV